MEGTQGPTYRGKFDKGIEVFEKSFDGYQKATFDAQRNEYNKSMHDALDAIGDSAKGMANKRLEEMKAQLQKDLDTYIDKPDAANKQHVLDDLNSLKS